MIKIGYFKGDGNAVNVECGFKPQYVRLVNVTQDSIYELFGGQGCHVCSLVAGSEAITADSDAISTYDSATASESDSEVSVSGYQGFKVNADIQTDDDLCYYLAIGHCLEEDHGDQA